MFFGWADKLVRSFNPPTPPICSLINFCYSHVAVGRCYFNGRTGNLPVRAYKFFVIPYLFWFFTRVLALFSFFHARTCVVEVFQFYFFYLRIFSVYLRIFSVYLRKLRVYLRKILTCVKFLLAYFLLAFDVSTRVIYASTRVIYASTRVIYASTRVIYASRNLSRSYPL